MKLEKKVSASILETISQTKGRTAEVSGTKNINAIKKIAQELKIEINVYNPQGEFNGYGYTRLPQVCEFPKIKVKNFLLKKVENKKAPKKKTYEEKKEAWVKRLVRLTDISPEEAKAIASEKEDYHQDRINELIDRDCERPSRKRGKLIEKLERENPLRPIRDEEHAQAILRASERHNNSNYEALLEEGKELREIGECDNVQEYARQNMSLTK
jgi:hypothetical protein